MKIEIRRVEYRDVEALRELYRREANCQIVHDMTLRRKNADPYLIMVDGRLSGYAGVNNRHDAGRLMEFYTLPDLRSFALPMIREVLAASGATQVEAQTNMPLLLLMLYDCTRNIRREAVLFEDALTTHHVCAEGVFRRATLDDNDSVFLHQHEPVGDWVIATNEGIVATGGFLTHYNPPYGDVYMEVAEAARRRGFGSYLVQEIKRLCYQAGRKPCARCDPDNRASRRTLEKAGFLACGSLLVGDVSLAT